MERRKFLTLAGGGMVVAAGAGLGSVAVRTPDNATAPWRQAGKNYKDPRKRALSYAILAPNPHNMQPWQVDLSQENQVKLTVDTNRMLPHTDPLNRQITIGLGCFLEVLELAAKDDGFQTRFDLFPQGFDSVALDERPVAIINFEPNQNLTADPLFEYVLQRRSLKEPYDLDRPVPADALLELQSVSTAGTAIGGNNEPDNIRALRELTSEALVVELETPRTYKESVDLFRIGKTEVEANPDGIDFSGPFFEILHFFGMFSREGSLDPGSTQFQQGKETVLANTETAMAHIWQVTETNTRIDQINAGRDWVRINLAATKLGLGIQPLSQALQEYPEMQMHYKAIHKMLAPNGGTVQMLARLGYGKRVPPSPRWPLGAKIIEG